MIDKKPNIGNLKTIIQGKKETISKESKSNSVKTEEGTDKKKTDYLDDKFVKPQVKESKTKKLEYSTGKHIPKKIELEVKEVKKELTQENFSENGFKDTILKLEKKEDNGWSTSVIDIGKDIIAGGDKKQKLSFLTNMNSMSKVTEETFGKKDPEGVKQIKSFVKTTNSKANMLVKFSEDILENKENIEPFKKFAKTEHNEEPVKSLDFLRELDESDEKDLPNKSKEFYNKYIDPNSESELNISNELRTKINDSLSNNGTIDAEVRKLIKSAVTSELYNDTYSRFQRTPDHLNIGYQKLAKE